MSPEILRLLFAYDAWANRRALDACAALAPEQFTRNLGSSFPSVRDTLAHILGGQWLWLERLHGRLPAALPKPEEFPDLAVLRARWDEVQCNLTDYVNQLSPADLERVIEYRNLKGEPMHNPVWQALHQVANHGTYHRGQVTTLLRQLGAKPAATDLVVFYRQRAAAQSQ
jgi:uncharacterized damage-inducible protein DinB